MRISDWSSDVCSSDLAVDATDVVVAVAASGHTPFTLRAIEDARVRGALKIAIANNASTPVLQAAQHDIFLGPGSEIISGSTRRKAGTAQKAAIDTIQPHQTVRLRNAYVAPRVQTVAQTLP